MKLDEGGQIYGAGVILGHTAALAKEFEGVRQGDADIEFIHRMRVASRRLRAALPIFADCLPKRKADLWLRQVRKITAALGEARDADVQIEHLADYLRRDCPPAQRPGIERLLLRLRQKRAGLQPDLNQALDRLREQNTLGELQAALSPLTARSGEVFTHTAALYRHSHASIQPRLAALLEFDPIVPDPAKVSELHQMRIAAKWLRYTLEAFAPLYSGELKKWLSAVRNAQEILGTIHDCDVWLVFLPTYLVEERDRARVFYGHTRPYPRLIPGVSAFGDAQRAEREEAYARFVEQWETWKGKNLWANLSRTLSVPLQALETIYPPLSDLAPDEEETPGAPPATHTATEE